MHQRDVEFLSDNLKIRGVLRMPETRGPHPIVIMAHGMGGLKEWNIPPVAEALVEAGIAALSFDYRNFGDSEGDPREEVDHNGQIEDFRNAITYALTLNEVDPERVGLWGTSLGGRNVLAATALDERVKCVLSQVPALGTLDEAYTRGAAAFTGGDVARFKRELAEDRIDRANGKPVRYFEFDNEDTNTEYYEHFSRFGEAELRNWKKRMTFRSYEPSIPSEITHLLKRIAPRPVLLVLTDRDYLYAGQMAAYAAMPEPKALLILPGHHYALYTTHKKLAIEITRDWFVKHLK